jgi:hypothetical protein
MINFLHQERPTPGLHADQPHDTVSGLSGLSLSGSSHDRERVTIDCSSCGIFLICLSLLSVTSYIMDDQYPGRQDLSVEIWLC